MVANPGDSRGSVWRHPNSAHWGMLRDVRPPISQLERLQGQSPSPRPDLEVCEWLTGFAEKNVVVPDSAGRYKPGPQGELPIEYSQCSGAKRNPAVISGFGLTTIDPCDTRFVDTDNSVHPI